MATFVDIMVHFFGYKICICLPNFTVAKYTTFTQVRSLIDAEIPGKKRRGRRPDLRRKDAGMRIAMIAGDDVTQRVTNSTGQNEGKVFSCTGNPRRWDKPGQRIRRRRAFIQVAFKLMPCHTDENINAERCNSCTLLGRSITDLGPCGFLINISLSTSRMDDSRTWMYNSLGIGNGSFNASVTASLATLAITGCLVLTGMASISSGVNPRTSTPITVSSFFCFFPFSRNTAISESLTDIIHH